MAQQPARVQMRPPPRLQLFVALVAAAAVAAAAYTVSRGRPPTALDVAVAAGLAGLVALAHLFPVHMAQRVRLSADTAPAFVGVLTLPAPLAVAVSVVGIAGGEAVRRTALIQFAYNVAVAALRSAAAAAVLSALAPERLEGAPGAREALAVVLAALTMYVTNGVLIEAVIAVQRRRSPLPGLWARRRASLSHESSLLALAVLFAATGTRWPLLAALLLIPALFAYLALRQSAAGQMRTRDGLEALADVTDRRLPDSADHSRRVADVARAVGLAMGLTVDDAQVVFHAARVQNVGYADISPAILTKREPLTDAEWAAIREHPVTADRLLAEFPEYAAARELVVAHHERWDGHGYPKGLRGGQIPLGARIIAAADTYVALTSPRPYRDPLPVDIARAELRGARGNQLDPRVVDALFSVLDQHPELAHGPVVAPRRSARWRRPTS